MQTSCTLLTVNVALNYEILTLLTKASSRHQHMEGEKIPEVYNSSTLTENAVYSDWKMQLMA